MRIINSHRRFGTDELRPLLEFAARGLPDARIEVHVVETQTSLRGTAYPRLAVCERRMRGRTRIRSQNTEYLVVLRLPQKNRFPTKTSNCYRLKRLARKWPDGLPLESWQDGLVHLAAHEFRHIWQFRKRRKAGSSGKPRLGEYDAEKHACTHLNRWRVFTNRDAVEAVKQPNPFA